MTAALDHHAGPLARLRTPFRSRELVSLLASRAVAVLGVLLLGWDGRLILFLLSCEAIGASAILTWLFNYPDRSTARGALFALIAAPTGFLMWVVLAKASPVVSVGELVIGSLESALVAVLLIVWHTVVAAREGQRRAAEAGTSIETNNRILLAWIFGVYAPFAVLTGVIVAWGTINAWALAAMLAAKTVIDVAFPWFERRV